MLRFSLSFVFLAVLLFQRALAQTSQLQREVVTDKSDTHDTPVAHPLSWWTQDPLRLDVDRTLPFGLKATDGHLISAQDYRVEQKVTDLCVLSTHAIVQIITTIYAQPGLALDTSTVPGAGPPISLADLPPAQWKSLLVKVPVDDRSVAPQPDQYFEIYRLQADGGLFQSLKSASVYGVGPNAILGTFDPDGGNGGGCADGYWWFDAAGAHPVDFSQLDRAITTALPPDTVYTSRCWALHPEESRLKSGVQKRNATCHACDWVGEVVATYRIRQGAALPVSVHFQPNPEQ
ncbi:hypothetical protein RBB79_18755 [Tunturiibacter empetritectus]|uniref:Uncharacterized protein n=2 Tax=Tunturiibacter TaxID=3154218 RepID=A0A852VMR8_9BACT|nr:hypothetical protein [Edaphobacter lichenicola]NYF91704.1 hypothetical protein [Edaphobacter lichenicola]